MQKTPLHANHVALGAKMGAFAGYDMPLYYDQGVMKEHEWVRNRAGLFDVSHMGQITLEGEDAATFCETLTPSAFTTKKNGRAQYTVLLNEDGGIIDDLIITRLEENKFFAVVNAGRKEVDIDWMRDRMPGGMVMEFWQDRGLIALQGPCAEAALRDALGIDTHALPYMHIMYDVDAGFSHPVHISRLGYTGEDGFEISVDEHDTAALWDKLLTHDDVRSIGLAARDSLRLDMGYPLYGHDIDETTSPVEAGIKWIISKHNDTYPGYDRIQQELAQGAARTRVGIKLLDRGVAREGADIFDQNGTQIGTLTSGGFSPSLQQAIGQGYIKTEYVREGTDVFVRVRNRDIAARVTAMPFVPASTKSIARPKAA